MRKGEYIEVRVRKAAGCREVAETCGTALHCFDSSSDDEEENPVLLRANGTMILDCPIQSSSSEATDWTIGSYMGMFQSFVKSGIPVKLGVGYSIKVCLIHTTNLRYVTLI